MTDPLLTNRQLLSYRRAAADPDVVFNPERRGGEWVITATKGPVTGEGRAPWRPVCTVPSTYRLAAARAAEDLYRQLADKYRTKLDEEDR